MLEDFQLPFNYVTQCDVSWDPEVITLRLFIMASSSESDCGDAFFVRNQPQPYLFEPSKVLTSQVSLEDTDKSDSDSSEGGVDATHSVGAAGNSSSW